MLKKHSAPHQSSKSEVKDAPSTSHEPKSQRRLPPELFKPASTSPFLGGTSRESHHSRMMVAATHRLWQVDVSFSSSGGCSVVQLMMIHDDIWFLHKLAEDCNTISSSINNSCKGQATGELLVGVPL